MWGAGRGFGGFRGVRRDPQQPYHSLNAHTHTRNDVCQHLGQLDARSNIRHHKALNHRLARQPCLLLAAGLDVQAARVEHVHRLAEQVGPAHKCSGRVGRDGFGCGPWGDG